MSISKLVTNWWISYQVLHGFFGWKTDVTSFILSSSFQYLSFGDGCCSLIYMYHFIDVAMTWTEAQQYCRQHYTDLATIHNTEDLDKLTRPSTYTGDAWIGLFDDVASWKGVMGNDSNSWRWSVTGTTSMDLLRMQHMRVFWWEGLMVRGSNGLHSNLASYEQENAFRFEAVLFLQV
uniref:C-type lectin domain-containing protein n=1 Tax=Periophthalmus magnuspinnatus TaxID=409849 RepID=A0A3B4AGX4_9GOBI